MRFMSLEINEAPIAKETKLDAWLNAYIQTGDAVKSVAIAGYETKNPDVIASQNLKRCAGRILEETKHHIGKLAPQAIKTLDSIMQDSKAADSNRITAEKALASYSGLDVQLTEDLTKHDNRSDQELQEALVTMIKDKNVPPELMQAFRIATNNTSQADVIDIKAVKQ